MNTGVQNQVAEATMKDLEKPMKLLIQIDAQHKQLRATVEGDNEGVNKITSDLLIGLLAKHYGCTHTWDENTKRGAAYSKPIQLELTFNEFLTEVGEDRTIIVQL